METEVKSLTDAQIEGLKKKAVDKFTKAIAKAENSAWELAKVSYNIVKADNFKEVFGNLDTFAKEVNYSKASISRFVKAYDRKLAMVGFIGDEAEEYTTSQVYEICAVKEDDTEDFLSIKEITPATSTRDIKAKAKAYNNPVSESDSTEDTEATADSSEDAEEITVEELNERAVKNINFGFIAFANGEYLANIDHTEGRKISQSQLEEILAIINQ